MTDTLGCSRVALMKISILPVFALCLMTSGCSLVTVPIKTAGSIVTTTVSTTGKVVTAPFDAVGGNNAARQDSEDVQQTQVVGRKPQRRTMPTDD